MDGNNMPPLQNTLQCSSAELEMFLKFREQMAASAGVPSIINASLSGGSSSNEGTSIAEESEIFATSNTNNSSGSDVVNEKKEDKQDMAKLLESQEDCYDDGIGLDPTRYPDMKDRIRNAIRDRIWKQLKVLTDSQACFQKPDFVRCNFPNHKGEYDDCPQAVFMVEEIFDAMGSDWDKSDLEKKIKFWMTYGNFIKYEFGRYRNQRVGVMKKAFLDATKEWEVNAKGYDMHCFKSTIESFLEKNKRISLRDSLRSSINADDKEIAVSGTFFDLFLSHVVGKSNYNNKIGKKMISDLATVSDEAFALVILEAYYSVWFQEYYFGKASIKNLFPKFSAKDPKVREEQDGGDKRNGWGIAMINAFNEYHKYISVICQEDGNKEFEAKFQEEKAVSTRVKAGQKRSVIRTEPILKVEGVLKRQRDSDIGEDDDYDEKQEDGDETEDEKDDNKIDDKTGNDDVDHKTKKNDDAEQEENENHLYRLIFSYKIYFKILVEGCH
ncbi:predicted protein [Chaetoceros tenuissimus]|uniref:Uncharacterized protein n=1 Tax=Chaetoceros tenuissimus TaxID=426638 RepID=A0AAD3GZ59_9STRA|nr:predicted protein [Chaetoceros tenuissimus]